MPSKYIPFYQCLSGNSFFVLLEHIHFATSAYRFELLDFVLIWPLFMFVRKKIHLAKKCSLEKNWCEHVKFKFVHSKIQKKMQFFYFEKFHYKFSKFIYMYKGMMTIKPSYIIYKYRQFLCNITVVKPPIILAYCNKFGTTSWTKQFVFVFTAFK